METYRSAAELQAAAGKTLGPSDWVAVEQDRMNSFADATSDLQSGHGNPTGVAAHPDGIVPVRGDLLLSLVPYFISRLRRIEGATLGVNYGLDRVRFPVPVMVGRRIRGEIRFLSVVEIDSATVHLVTRATVEAEGGDAPCCVADLVTRIYF